MVNKGSEYEECEAEHYRRKGCIVQKVYLRATYAPHLVARPGDFFAVPETDDNGDPVLDRKGRQKKKGSVDVIAICPDAVHLVTVTSIKDGDQSRGGLYKRERALSRAIPPDYPVQCDSALYIGSKRHVVRRHRNAQGEWVDETPTLMAAVRQ